MTLSFAIAIYAIIWWIVLFAVLPIGVRTQEEEGEVSPAVDQPEHGVTTVFIELPNTKVELLGTLGDKSPISAFLQRNPNGGIHHLCYEVPDIVAARDRLVADGARVLGQGDPKIGAHGKPVLFLHPKDFCGTLVELEQA